MPKLHLECDVVKGKQRRKQRKPRRRKAPTPRSNFIQAQKVEVKRCIAAVKKEAENGKQLVKDAVKTGDVGLAKKVIAAFGGAAATIAQSPELRGQIFELGKQVIGNQLALLRDVRIPF